jgi:Glycosyl hydrolases family 2, TIM barrel domain
MTYKLSIVLIWLCVGMSTCYGLVFEDYCESVSHWDVLDYKADGEVYVTEDPSCPSAYGPDVLHVEGGVVLGLAKAVELTQGTLVVLYKENQPRKEDGDGVIMVGAHYGQDIAQEHNTKIMRAHVWLEQDNDCGIQYRAIDAQGQETQLQERAGVGLVTDAWNRTGWIWQKVKIEGDLIQAKFWPAEQAEPAGWTLESRYVLPGARFGLRINSGDINVAYFAADTADITPQIPRAHLFFPQAQTTRAERIQMTLFTNAEQGTNESLAITVSREGRQLAHRKFHAQIGPGHGEMSIVLSHGMAEPDSEIVHVPLKEALPDGVYKVVVASDSGLYTTQGIFQVARATDEQQRFAEAQGQIDRLGMLLQGLQEPHEKRASLQVVHDAAHAHLERAQGLLAAGQIEAARDSFRFVTEALSELKGYKGAWLKELVPTWEGASWPKKVAPSFALGLKDQGCLDFYSPFYCLRFGQATLEAQSFVMGRKYKVVIPWEVAGGRPDRDFDFHVRLVSPLGSRTVASARAGLSLPTSQWEAGEVYRQRIELEVLAEDAQPSPANPLVLDEYHALLVTVTDPVTGASVLLGNQPGRHPDRVGQSFLVDTLYVSSTPLEIRHFQPGDSAVGQSRQERVVLANVGHRDLTLDALFRVTTESERVICEQVRSIEIPAQGQQEITYDWIPRAVGELTVQVRLMQEGVVRTQAERAIEIAPPKGCDVAVVKELTVERRAGGFVTPLTVHVGAGLSVPVSVKVLAQGRVVGKAQGTGGDIKVTAEPWFGYYDVQIECETFSYNRRIIATVVEVKDADLLVNGEPFLIKGVNVHGMDASSPERTASMMRIMADLGFNAWRGDYPAPWQVDLAYELNTFYTVLAPFSCKSTQTIFARQAGPPLATARELTRLFVQRYRDSAGVLLWNSANEIQGENIDFLLAQYPVYKAYDPEKRPVHYANLYGQDLWQGQDAMGVNYYFGENQRAADRQPLIERSVELGQAHGIPTLFCEYNSYLGAIHSTGVEAMEDLFAWGVEKGSMSGGFLYMKINSTSHPGVFDAGFNTHAIFDNAIRAAFADARVELVGAVGSHLKLRIINKRRFTLRQAELHLKASDIALPPIRLADIAPAGTIDVDVTLPDNVPGPAALLKGQLSFVTHYGFRCKVNIALIAKTADAGAPL